MEKTIKQLAFPPIVFELLGLAFIFIAYLLAGGQNRLIPTPGYSLPFALAILGIALCSGALILRGKEIFERKRGGQEIFFDGVDALIIFPFMFLLGARLLKWEGSFCLMFGCSMEIPADIFNTLSWVLVVMAIVTSSLGVVSMLLQPQRQ